jgi:hypothetical protein
MHMTVTMAIRYTVGDLKVAMAETKRAKAMWMKAGAKHFRVSQFFTGQFNGQWLFQVVFDDLGHLQKVRDIALKTSDWATIVKNNVKGGNKQVGREILLGMDV